MTEAISEDKTAMQFATSLALSFINDFSAACNTLFSSCNAL